MSIATIMEAEIRRLKAENKTLKEKIHDLEYNNERMGDFIENNLREEEEIEDLTELLRGGA